MKPYILFALLFGAVMGNEPAHASAGGPFICRLIPSAGYSLGFTEVSNQSSYTMAHGPTGNLKLYVQSEENYFLAPTLETTFLFGTDSTEATLLGLGLGAGGYNTSLNASIWGGLSYDWFPNYKAGNTLTFKAGYIFGKPEKEDTFEITAFYSSLPVTTPTAITYYSYLGATLTYHFQSLLTFGHVGKQKY